jgi:hypothetical protein
MNAQTQQAQTVDFGGQALLAAMLRTDAKLEELKKIAKK